MNPTVINLFKRAVAWLSRNRVARANALELAAASIRNNADRLEREGKASRAKAARGRADLLETRARQFREAR